MCVEPAGLPNVLSLQSAHFIVTITKICQIKTTWREARATCWNVRNKIRSQMALHAPGHITERSKTVLQSPPISTMAGGGQISVGQSYQGGQSSSYRSCNKLTDNYHGKIQDIIKNYLYYLLCDFATRIFIWFLFYNVTVKDTVQVLVRQHPAISFIFPDNDWSLVSLPCSTLLSCVTCCRSLKRKLETRIRNPTKVIWGPTGGNDESVTTIRILRKDWLAVSDTMLGQCQTAVR